MAEIEIAVLKEQSLDQRIPTMEMLKREVRAWEDACNWQHATVEWRFTSRKVRSKLKRLYPIIQQKERKEITCQN
jgi:hypothetical protein